MTIEVPHADNNPLRAFSNPLIFAAALFLAVYGVELFNFGLSIDEEAATYISDNGLTWLQQGRWGMALITLVLPNFEAIPLLSTLLFAAGLLYATWRAFGDFILSPTERYFFAAVHVGFPIWLHIAQFSTLAAGFGVGIASASLGAAAVSSGRKPVALIGVLLIAFAMSIYQTLGLYALLYIVLCAHASLTRGDSSSESDGGHFLERYQLPRMLLAASGWLAGVVLYVLIQKLALAVLDKDMVYVSDFMKLDLLLTDPTTVLMSSAAYFGSLLGGSHPAYLGWGPGVLFLVWLGLLPLFIIDGRQGFRNNLKAWLATLLVASIAIFIVAIPMLMSNGGLPMRAQVAFPLLAAWLASRCGMAFQNRSPLVMGTLIAYFSIVVTSIGASLFYVDQVVHKADAALTQRLVPAIQEAAGTTFGNGEIPISLVGARPFKFGGSLKRAELFGTSFYEHDQGNIYRVALFMQLQGVEGMTPVWLKDRPELIPAAGTMPIWPAEGSVQLVHGVVLVKLGPPSPPQIHGP